MSNLEDMNAKAIKRYQGFEEGTYAARKGRLCFIKKIHFEMHPPSVTVQMMDTDTEVGTEFDRLQHLHSWFCDMCSAENKDVQAKKCFFCKMDRSYKEKITIVDAADNTHKAPPSDKLVQVDEQDEEDTHTKEEETSDEASEESKLTDDEYEEVADAESKPSDHELSTEEEPEPALQFEPHAHVHPVHTGKPPQQQHVHWPSYQYDVNNATMQGHPEHSHGHRAASRHGHTAQNRKRPHTDFLPPPPAGQRRAASNGRNKSRRPRNMRTRSQPHGFWMDDEDAMQFRRPLNSYWPRSWWNWDW